MVKRGLKFTQECVGIAVLKRRAPGYDLRLRYFATIRRRQSVYRPHVKPGYINNLGWFPRKGCEQVPLNNLPFVPLGLSEIVRETTTT